MLAQQMFHLTWPFGGQAVRTVRTVGSRGQNGCQQPNFSAVDMHPRDFEGLFTEFGLLIYLPGHEQLPGNDL